MTNAQTNFLAQNNESRIPQLRVILNTDCGKRCLYCRPSGEAACSIPTYNRISREELQKCISVLVDGGIREIRLTGGDPALYPQNELISLVGGIAELGIHNLSIVTRNGRIRTILPMLKAAGLTHITFSLDSMNAERWVTVCGISAKRIKEHQELLDTIREAKRIGLKVNLNSVLLNDTCEIDLPALVDFAGELSINLKIEEIIRDIGQNDGDGRELHANLEPLKLFLRQKAECSEIIHAPGGLGHPMEVFHLDNHASVTWKMFAAGTCYGPSCRECRHFPCDDALMALRLLPDGKLQTCLKRDDNLLDLISAIREGNGSEIAEMALAEYKNSTRYSFDEINSIRENQSRGISA